jgi:hypothetical protein
MRSDKGSFMNSQVSQETDFLLSYKLVMKQLKKIIVRKQRAYKAQLFYRLFGK